jgi:hypothetical protein
MCFPYALKMLQLVQVLQLQIDTSCPFCPYRDNHESQIEGEWAQKSSKSSISQSRFSPISPFGDGNVFPFGQKTTKANWRNLLLLLPPDQVSMLDVNVAMLIVFPSIR